MYDLPQLPGTKWLPLTGQVLGDIYLSKIKTWNDPAIEKLNPTIALPKQEIFVNFRRDGSGTTFTFTDYLTKVNPSGLNGLALECWHSGPLVFSMMVTKVSLTL